jgi:regulator of replication initiation timing
MIMDKIENLEKKKKAELLNYIETLYDEIDYFETENDFLKSENDKLENINDDLQDDIRELESQIENQYSVEEIIDSIWKLYDAWLEPTLEFQPSLKKFFRDTIDVYER